MWMNSNQLFKFFGGKKSRVIVQHTGTQKYCMGKDKETGTPQVKQCYRESWTVSDGVEFVATFFPRVGRAWKLDPQAEKTISLKQVKQLLFYAKTYPNVLEVYQIAVQQPDEISLPTIGETGDTVTANIPTDNQNQDCDAAASGDK